MLLMLPVRIETVDARYLKCVSYGGCGSHAVVCGNDFYVEAFSPLLLVGSGLILLLLTDNIDAYWLARQDNGGLDYAISFLG